MTTVVISGNTIAADNKITSLQKFEGEELKEQLKQFELASREVPNYSMIKDLVIESYTNPPETTTKIFDVSEMGFTIEGDLKEFIRGVSVYDSMTGSKSDLISF